MIISDVLVLFCSGIEGDLVIFGHKIAPGVPSIGTFLLFVIFVMYILYFCSKSLVKNFDIVPWLAIYTI